MTRGEVRYLQIPSDDPERSAAFYEAVFGWEIRRRDDGAIAFDDTSGHVSGMWVTGHPVAAEPGLLIWIRVARRAGRARGDRASRGRDRDAGDAPEAGRGDRHVSGSGGERPRRVPRGSRITALCSIITTLPGAEAPEPGSVCA